MNNQKSQAALALIFQGTSVLGVSRKEDPSAFGLPGGKVEEGESTEEAMVRELAEETGLVAREWSHIHSREDADGFEVHTFLVKATGTLHTEEEGVPAWVSISALLVGPFGEYNREMFLELLGYGYPG